MATQKLEKPAQETSDASVCGEGSKKSKWVSRKPKRTDEPRIKSDRSMTTVRMRLCMRLWEEGEGGGAE